MSHHVTEMPDLAPHQLGPVAPMADLTAEVTTHKGCSLSDGVGHYWTVMYESSRTRHLSYLELPGYPHPTGWTPRVPRAILGESKFLL